MSAISDRMNENLAKLGAQLDLFTVTLNHLNEVINGTAKTGGLKERIAMAEGDIKKNKESFDTINKNITELRNEMLIEVGKIASSVNEGVKQKSAFSKDLWQGTLKAVVAALAVGVTGILFWQLIIWLAANAPVK